MSSASAARGGARNVQRVTEQENGCGVPRRDFRVWSAERFPVGAVEDFAVGTVVVPPPVRNGPVSVEEDVRKARAPEEIRIRIEGIAAEHRDAQRDVVAEVGAIGGGLQRVFHVLVEIVQRFLRFERLI